ncbi:hypothetical protein CDAR_209991 [Caerostris darwini]|uniref:Uncharacterized protein n=1 Tax=Caerostris darwini TaxID=1538125 RepID=A0AAV4QF59_9ARAC|nr:hypothetical protein CDAR_209991 [Caerostris darwini]
MSSAHVLPRLTPYLSDAIREKSVVLAPCPNLSIVPEMLSIVFPKWQNKRGAVVENRLLHKHTHTSTLLLHIARFVAIHRGYNIICILFFTAGYFFIHPFLFSYILLLGGLHFWNTHSLYFFEAALVISLRSAFSARGKKKKYGKAKVEFLLNGARSGSPYQRDYILPIDGPAGISGALAIAKFQSGMTLFGDLSGETQGLIRFPDNPSICSSITWLIPPKQNVAPEQSPVNIYREGIPFLKNPLPTRFTSML